MSTILRFLAGNLLLLDGWAKDYLSLMPSQPVLIEGIAIDAVFWIFVIVVVRPRKAQIKAWVRARR